MQQIRVAVHLVADYLGKDPGLEALELVASVNGALQSADIDCQPQVLLVDTGNGTHIWLDQFPEE